ncbi:MAG: PhoU domain-containing protein [Thermoplasmata archaeon]
MNYIDNTENIEKSKTGEQTHEEVRKIQFTGKSTYVVSLPKKWVSFWGLKAGSQVTIYQKGDSLVLTPRGSGRPQERSNIALIKVSSDDEADAIGRKIIALYLLGYKYIYIKTDEKSIDTLQRTRIKDLIRKKLVGTEIISETEEEIKIQVLVRYPYLSIENALKRMCLIASFMHEKSIQALKNQDKKLASEIINLDDEVDRFGLYVVRQLKAAVVDEQVLQEIGLSSRQDCLGYRVIVKFVERIADHATTIAKSIIETDIKITDKEYTHILEMSNLARKSFEDAIKALFTKDCTLAEEVISNERNTVIMEGQAIKELQSRRKISEIANMRMILESIRRCAEYACDIAEVVINLNIENELAEKKNFQRTINS